MKNQNFVFTTFCILAIIAISYIVSMVPPGINEFAFTTAVFVSMLPIACITFQLCKGTTNTPKYYPPSYKTHTDHRLLAIVAEKLNTHFLANTMWKDERIHDILKNVIKECHENYKNHKEAMCWIDQSKYINRHVLGLSSESSIIMEDYAGGELTPPPNTYIIRKRPQVYRVTNVLLQYVNEHLFPSVSPTKNFAEDPMKV